jgi:hypothetical protein
MKLPTNTEMISASPHVKKKKKKKGTFSGAAREHILCSQKKIPTVRPYAV